MSVRDRTDMLNCKNASVNKDSCRGLETCGFADNVTARQGRTFTTERTKAPVSGIVLWQAQMLRFITKASLAAIE